jgi:circadian clock protein KaiC
MKGNAKTGRKNKKLVVLEKCPTGIGGLDEVTAGGLPKGRPTLVCGSAGAGKTVVAMEFLVRGATQYNEPGVFVAFEETEEELSQNVASLGFDLRDLVARKELVVDYVRVERSEIEETGEYNLEGLFIRIDQAITSIGAKRIVFDTIESLFAALPNEAILRAELRRLFRWTKDKGVTTIVTAERGEGQLTRHGLEEYVADCVILLDHRVKEQVSTRRLRVVKYRGSEHGTNEYPFLIDREGVSVMPVTSLGLDHTASEERISSGIPQLDEMLEGKGYYRGSSVLLSGAAGSGKSSVAAAFVVAAARRGQKALYFAFEESMSQILRNMRSIGLELEPWVKRGLLQFHAARPTFFGLEMHLVSMHHRVRQFRPDVIVVDPVSNLVTVGTAGETKAMLTRLIDFLKGLHVTALFTSLSATEMEDQTDVGVSSLMDTWLLLRNLESNGERNRALYILKSRGSRHSNQVREFVLSNRGIQLVDVYTGTGTVLTGSARLAQETREKAETTVRQQNIARFQRQIALERQTAEARIAAMRAETEARIEALIQQVSEATLAEQAIAQDRERLGTRRMAGRDGAPERTPRATKNQKDRL